MCVCRHVCIYVYMDLVARDLEVHLLVGEERVGAAAERGGRQERDEIGPRECEVAVDQRVMARISDGPRIRHA